MSSLAPLAAAASAASHTRSRLVAPAALLPRWWAGRAGAARCARRARSGASGRLGPSAKPAALGAGTTGTHNGHGRAIPRAAAAVISRSVPCTALADIRGEPRAAGHGPWRPCAMLVRGSGGATATATATASATTGTGYRLPEGAAALGSGVGSVIGWYPPVPASRGFRPSVGQKSRTRNAEGIFWWLVLWLFGAAPSAKSAAKSASSLFCPSQR
jgi:hypothetical protein